MVLGMMMVGTSAFAPTPMVQQPRVQQPVVSMGVESMTGVGPETGDKMFDPLKLSTLGGEKSLAFFRHAEIKHGRVAMAAFVGYLLQANGVHWPWPASLDGTPFPSAALSPPEQWDALTSAAKYQIIIFIGFLEHFSESTGTHYMRGGVPGKFENFRDHPEYGIPHPIPLNLYDPFGLTKKISAEKKERGLVAEINNGRLAMLGIISVLAAQSVEGSVPLLTGVLPHYDGQVMSPF